MRGLHSGILLLLEIGLIVGAVLGTAAVAAAICTVTIDDFDGNGSIDLRVIGDSANQTLRIVDNPTANTARVFLDCDGDGTFSNAAAGDRDGSVAFLGGFELFDIKLANGDDDVTIEVPIETVYLGKNRNFVVQLGQGTNSFRFVHDGGTDFPMTAFDSRLTIDVQGGAGADDVTFRFNGASASLIVLRADLGAGSDRVTLSTPDIARYEVASVVDADFQLGNGDDTVTYHPTADVFGGSVYRVNIAGGAGADTVDGGLFSLVSDGRLFLNVDLGTGDDALTWGSSPMIGADGSVHITIDGGAGNDVLTIQGAPGGPTSNIHGLVEVIVRGGPGNDAASVNVSPEDGADVFGTLRVHVDGDVGSDTLHVFQLSKPGSSGKYDFLLRGGLGADSLLLTFLNSGANLAANYTPTGVALLDGGPASDECKVVGVVLERRQNCEP